MPTYGEVKTESIYLVDRYSHDHDVKGSYGRPPGTPKYSAATKLVALGINVYVRRAMMKPVNEHMRAKFGADWRSVGVSELEGVETIGAFIKLMCACASTIVPFGEPT